MRLAYASPVLGATGIEQLASGSSSSHTCAAKADGSAVCWGANVDWGLGTDRVARSWQPLLVDGVTTASRLCTGPRTSSVASADGRVITWGVPHTLLAENGGPQLPGPLHVPGLSGVTQIACGERHGCSLGENGVVCFGNDSYGQLGRGGSTEEQEPFPANSVSVLDGARTIATGGWRSCAATHDGSLYCWGENVGGDLGVGIPDVAITRPLRVPGFGPE